jgi:hypothetical protein
MKDDAPYQEIEAMQKIALAVYNHKSIPADILVSKQARFHDLVGSISLEREVADKGIAIYG